MVNYHFPPNLMINGPTPNQQLQIDRKCFRSSESGFSNSRVPPIAPLTRPVISRDYDSKLVTGYPSQTDQILRPIPQSANFRDVRYDMESTPVSIIFLSQDNQNHILKLICQILRRIFPSNPISEEAQNKSELLAFSRQIFLNQSTNSPDQLAELEKLNSIVIDYLVPRMISGMETHCRFLYDVSNPTPCPIDKPVKTRCFKGLSRETL